MAISQMRSAFGPLAQTLPRVALILFCGTVAIIAAGEIGRAVHMGCGSRLTVAWTVALLAVVGGCLAFRSFAQFGSQMAPSDPLSLAGLLAFASEQRVPIAAAAAVGVLVATACWRRAAGRNVSAAAVLGEKPDKAAAIGALGEALVAGRLREWGYPTLRNVILQSATQSIEIDVLVRVADGIVVLETKTWSGFVSGAADSACWTRLGRGGRADVLSNAVRQNLTHVVAAENIVADPAVWIRGYVVSAGSATFSMELAPHIVSLDDLGTVMGRHAPPAVAGNPSADRAWSRLQGESMRSESRRVAHVVHARFYKRFLAGMG